MLKYSSIHAYNIAINLPFVRFNIKYIESQVYNLQSPNGWYMLTQNEAEELCLSQGATLATTSELRVASNAGWFFNS